MTERNEDFRGTMLEIASRVAIVLTGLACIALFIGCGGDSDGGASQGSSNPEVASSSEGSPDYGESSEPMGDQAPIGGADEDHYDISEVKSVYLEYMNAITDQDFDQACDLMTEAAQANSIRSAKGMQANAQKGMYKLPAEVQSVAVHDCPSAASVEWSAAYSANTDEQFESDIESADVSFSGNFAKIEGSKPGDFWYGYFQFIDDQWLITDDVPCCDL